MMTSSRRLTLQCTIVLGLLACMALSALGREWTDRDGNTLTGDFVRVRVGTGGQFLVFIKTNSVTVRNFPYAAFSDEDRTYIREQLEEEGEDEILAALNQLEANGQVGGLGGGAPTGGPDGGLAGGGAAGGGVAGGAPGVDGPGVAGPGIAGPGIAGPGIGGSGVGGGPGYGGDGSYIGSGTGSGGPEGEIYGGAESGLGGIAGPGAAPPGPGSGGYYGGGVGGGTGYDPNGFDPNAYEPNVYDPSESDLGGTGGVPAGYPPGNGIGAGGPAGYGGGPPGAGYPDGGVEGAMGDNLPYNFDPNTGRFSGFRQNGPQNQSSRPVQANALPPGSSLLNNPTGASSTAGRTRFSSDIVAEDPNEINEEEAEKAAMVVGSTIIIGGVVCGGVFLLGIAGLIGLILFVSKQAQPKQVYYP